MNKPRAWSLSPLTISLMYALLGGIWISFSDWALGHFVQRQGALTHLQTVKGWVFIVVTAVFLYTVLSRHMAAVRASETELVESRRKLDTLISNLPGTVYRCKNDPDWTMEIISEGCRELTGYGPEDLVDNRTLSYAQLIHPDDRAAVERAVQGGLAAGKPFEMTYRIRTRQGQEHWVWEKGQGVLSERGDLEALEGVIIDISARVVAEQEVREDQARLRLLLEQLPAVVWTAGEDLCLTSGLAGLAHLNLTPGEVAGKPLQDFFGVTDPAATPIAEHRRALRGEPVSYEFRWKTRTFDCRVEPVRDHEGRLVGVVGVALDVGERKNLEEQLRQSQKLEAIGLLSGGIAHDFNNLLNVILGYSELLTTDEQLRPAQQRRAEHIRQATLRAAGLTRQLLAFSRKQVLQPEVVSLNSILEDTSKLLRRIIGEHIDLQLALDPSLGTVEIDPGQMEQVILNLAVNARDAMPDGGQLVFHTSNTELDASYVSRHPYVQPGPYVMLAVTDTGQGMEEATRSRIFEPFFTTKEQGKGTGLGLSTVYGIVKQSGGYIWVYSEPGRGTTFKIYLPRVDKPESHRAEPPADVARGSETILVVEDDAALREFACECLTAAGYTVLQAGSAQEAMKLESRYSRRIDLLLTDVVMPGKSGRELGAHLTETRPGTRVLYVSGYTDDTIGRHGVLEPGLHFLQKPYSPVQLTAKVREVLDGAEGAAAS